MSSRFKLSSAFLGEGNQMRKKIAATTDLRVCGRPQKVIGQRQASLVPGYAVAADEAREREAQEW
jgi:hypothetical protein